MPDSPKPSLLFRLRRRLRRERMYLLNRWQIFRVAAQVARHASRAENGATVAFFRPSSALFDMNLNNTFHLLSAWALRLQGVRVVHFMCQAGMSRCVLGTRRDDASQAPPCEACVRFSHRLYQHQEVQAFTYAEDPDLAAALQELDSAALEQVVWDGLPLGKMVLPALRWVLRRHHLPDDEPTRFLLRQYILSARHVAQEFSAFLDRVQPQAVVLFNGTFYPEAVARHIARQRGIRAISHEVGLLASSAYFTEGEATAYPIDIPEEFDLNPAQNARLNAYLQDRFQGNFIMAGIRFWPEMRRLDEAFLAQAARFRQIVPVFTNVIFDTSQVHANTVFPHMFAWLDVVLEIAAAHPDTFFVIRAHPDETRPGKESRESVAQWAEQRNLASLPNVRFVPPKEYISSYELIQRARFVMIYNSSIGLEATLLGAPVLCAAKARYTAYPTVFFPQSIPEYRAQAEAFLGEAPIQVPPEFVRNARRFLYYQLYRTSLPVGEYYTPAHIPGFVILRSFNWRALTPEHSPSMRAILDGILHGGDFLLEDESA